MSYLGGIYKYGAILSPVAYYIFGRPLIPRSHFSLTDENINVVLGILRRAQDDISLILKFLSLSDPFEEGRRLYHDATRMWKVLNECFDSICMENSAMLHFWIEYDGIISRWSLTNEQIAYGKRQFEYWLDSETRRREALLKEDESKRVYELGVQYLERRKVFRPSTDS